jgi:hypothetical protein
MSASVEFRPFACRLFLEPVQLHLEPADLFVERIRVSIVLRAFRIRLTFSTLTVVRLAVLAAMLSRPARR